MFNPRFHRQPVQVDTATVQCPRKGPMGNALAVVACFELHQREPIGCADAKCSQAKDAGVVERVEFLYGIVRTAEAVAEAKSQRRVFRTTKSGGTLTTGSMTNTVRTTPQQQPG